MNKKLKRMGWGFFILLGGCSQEDPSCDMSELGYCTNLSNINLQVNQKKIKSTFVSKEETLAGERITKKNNKAGYYQIYLPQREDDGGRILAPTHAYFPKEVLHAQ